MEWRGKLRSGDDAYPAYSLDFVNRRVPWREKKPGEEAIHPKKFERGRLRRVRNGWNRLFFERKSDDPLEFPISGSWEGTAMNAPRCPDLGNWFFFSFYIFVPSSYPVAIFRIFFIVTRSDPTSCSFDRLMSNSYPEKGFLSQKIEMSGNEAVNTWRWHAEYRIVLRTFARWQNIA